MWSTPPSIPQIRPNEPHHHTSQILIIFAAYLAGDGHFTCPSRLTGSRSGESRSRKCAALLKRACISRFIDFVYHSTPSFRIVTKKKNSAVQHTGFCGFMGVQWFRVFVLAGASRRGSSKRGGKGEQGRDVVEAYTLNPKRS